MTDYKLVPVEPTPEMVQAYKAMWSPEFCDDRMAQECYAAIMAAAPAVQGEPVGEVRLELGAQPYVFAELYSKSLPSLAPGTKLYVAPQPAEQQPAADAAALVEALELLVILRGIIGGALWSLDDEDKDLAIRTDAAIAALAAYRKGGERP